MSRFLSFEVSGNALLKWCRNRNACAGEPVVLDVPMGDNVYELKVRRLPMECFTMPEEPAQTPCLNDVAEVVGRVTKEAMKEARCSLDKSGEVVRLNRFVKPAYRIPYEEWTREQLIEALEKGHGGAR